MEYIPIHTNTWKYKTIYIHIDWGRQDFFDFFFKSCGAGGQKKGKILKKVAVGAPAKVCLGQNLDFVRRSVIPKSLKIEYMKGNFAKLALLGKILQKSPKYTKISQKNGEISGQVYPCPTLLSI